MKKPTKSSAAQTEADRLEADRLEAEILLAERTVREKRGMPDHIAACDSFVKVNRPKLAMIRAAEALDENEALRARGAALQAAARLATRAIDSTITEAKRVVDDRDAARAQVAELSALLREAREAVDRGWRFPDGMPEGWRPLFVRELLAKIDTALAAAKETT